MRAKSQAAFTLLEVLITLIILAVGMLGLANLQSKIHVTEVESYQRAHAVLLLQDMVDRISSNRSTAAAAAYTDAEVLGTGTSEDCTAATLAAVTPAAAKLAAADRCEWSNALLGASEKRASDNANVGGMIGARGCIEEIQAPDNSPGVCTPGIYRITVAWQGLHKTSVPALDCGKDLYGGAANDSMRRVISTTVSIGLPRCTNP